MKKIFATLLCLLCCAVVVAQSHNRNITIGNFDGEKFWVYVNNIPVSKYPESCAVLRDICPETVYQIHIVMNNAARSEIVENIRVEGNADVVFLVRKISTFPETYGLFWYEKRIAANNGNYSYVRPQRINTQTIISERPLPPMPPAPPTPTPGPMAPPVVQPLPAPVPAPASTPQCCTHARFLSIKEMVAEKKFDSDRLTIAKQAATGERMTAEQLAEIAKLMQFENTKLDFLKFAYRFCCDPNRYYVVNAVFSYSSSTDELNEYILRFNNQNGH